MNIKIEKMEDLLYWYKGHIDRVIDGDTVVFSELDLGFSLSLKNSHGRLLGLMLQNCMQKKQISALKQSSLKSILHHD